MKIGFCFDFVVVAVFVLFLFPCGVVVCLFVLLLLLCCCCCCCCCCSFVGVVDDDFFGGVESYLVVAFAETLHLNKNIVIFLVGLKMINIR